MADYSIFPKINATLNGSSAVLLVTGRVLIARGKMAAHRAVMLTALATSSLFLGSYLYMFFSSSAVCSSDLGSSAVLLVTGRVLIARGKMAAHRAVMLTALATSSLFLGSYLYYHYHLGAVQ